MEEFPQKCCALRPLHVEWRQIIQRQQVAFSYLRRRRIGIGSKFWEQQLENVNTGASICM